jgi:hypothetical protein
MSTTVITHYNNTKPYQFDYYDTMTIINNYIEELKNTTSNDKRTEIVEKIFEEIIINPNILIYEPDFRNSVITKIYQLEKYIDARIKEFNKADYYKALDMMKVSISNHIKNSDIKNKIIGNINNISELIGEYEMWAKCNRLKSLFNILWATIENVKFHPNYVQ